MSNSLAVDAALSADARLLVPMRLQALRVADPGDMRWADLTPRYDLLGGNPPVTLGCYLRPNLFDPPREPPGAGVHLHWALPAAFTHVVQEPGKPAVFPPVPNRWLVVRLWEKSPKELGHRAWVVESDYLGPRGDGTSPWLALGGQPRMFRARDRIGRARDLRADAQPPGAPFLTAVAPGNIAFASFYPSCKNVFGFHDKADDLERDVVYSYIIVGWFAQSGADPLNGCRDKADWLARMGKHAWSVPDGTKVLPTRILCHGAVQDVRWPPSAADRAVSDFPHFEIAVGNSVLDAIAALVDQRTRTTQARDRLLGQLQFAVLQDRPPTAEELYSAKFPNRGRLTPLRARLHDKMFTATPGGTRWEIDRPGQDADQATSKVRPVLKLSGELARMLRKINRDQQEHDRQQRWLTGLQRDLYAQWHNKRLLARERMQQTERARRAGVLDRRIADMTPWVEPLRERIRSLRAGIEETAAAIRAQFAANPAWRDHVLIDRPMPNYWRANDPALLIAGVPIPAIQDGASPLVCRVTGQTLSSLYVPDVAEYGAASVSVANLKEHIPQELSSGIPAGIPSHFVELLCEALLLDPQRAPWLARIAYLKQKGFEPPQDQITKLAAALSQVQRRPSGDNFTVGDQSAATGSPLAAFRSALSATVTLPSPWTSVFMIWSARYFPARTDPAQDVLKPWRFDANDIDYRWAEPTPGALSGDADYQGYAPLSDTVGRGTSKGKEQSWQARYPEDKFVFDPLTAGSLVVQSMGGLTEALILQDATIQLPPLQENSLVIDEEMRQLVGEQYATAPLQRRLGDATSSFFPVRGGHLALQRLWLVDTFGRIRRVIDTIEPLDRNAPPPTVYISRSLGAPGSPDPNLIRLRPRLAQPSRLLFRWLSADTDEQEFLGDLATQPICGWILPNRLDQSLLICDAAGRALGAVQSVIRRGGWDDRGIRWSKLPLAAVDPAAAPPQAPRPSAEDIPNRHLLGFVNGLLGLADATGICRTAAFQDLLTLIAELDESNQRLPEQRDLSVLVGQPLALVRASLRLDLLSPPAVDQSWSQLAEPAPTPTDFANVPFGVRLGDRRKGSEGLIGYFRSDDYRTLHLAQDIEPETGARRDPYFQHQDAVPVTCEPFAPATLLTLLVDPRFGVHISSGILPTKIIDLPAELVSAALSTLEVPFLVAPVLGERRENGVPNIPLPTTMPGTWTWTWRPAAGAAAKSAEIKSETAPARSLFGTMALYEGWLALRQQGTDSK